MHTPMLASLFPSLQSLTWETDRRYARDSGVDGDLPFLTEVVRTLREFRFYGTGIEFNFPEDIRTFFSFLRGLSPGIVVSFYTPFPFETPPTIGWS